MDSTVQHIARFMACLRLGMRERYRASNSDLAAVLNEYAKERGYHANPQINGAILKTWGSVESIKIKPIDAWVVRTSYEFYLHRRLIPDNQNGWTGLIAVHMHITGQPGSTLPQYLHEAGLPKWLDFFNSNQGIAA